MNPLVIDLFAGLGGWSKGFLAEGYRCVGFDIERHRYPMVMRPESATKLPGNNSERRWSDRPISRLKDAIDGVAILDGWMEYPGQLVIQDVLTIHGSQFRDAACIVASPPCQRYSYMAMPFSRGKRLAAEIRADETGAKLADLNALFDACFRIQREASEAAGHHIPMVVENVRGAQPWVGRAPWNYGSFYLWGDVPALMPSARALKIGTGDAYERNVRPHLTNPAEQYKKQTAGDGKTYGGDFGWDASAMRTGSSKSPARKAASAAIAEIPFELAAYIARVFKPAKEAAA